MTDVAELLQIARTRHARTRETKSKLEPHRAFIIAAVSEGLPITTVQGVLEEHFELKVCYANLRAWIHRQAEFRKARKTASDAPALKRSAANSRAKKKVSLPSKSGRQTTP